MHASSSAIRPLGFLHVRAQREGGRKNVKHANEDTSVMNQDTRGWQRLDKAAFGIVYGAVTGLSILLAAGAHPEAPFETAAVLFGSVFAITLTKAFAEFLSHAIDSGTRPTRHDWRAAWRHSAPTLGTANLPTLLFIANGLGWITSETAIVASQGVCVALLALVGGRLGWVIDGSIPRSMLGATFAGGIGLALAVLKHVIH